MTTTNEGAGTKMADIVIRSVSKATETDIVESRTGRGSIGIGSSRSHMGTEIGSGNGMVCERESSTHCEGTIGAETMVALVVVVVGCAWRGSTTRNTSMTMIGAVSSGTMMSVVTIEGVRRAHRSQGLGRGGQAWKEGSGGATREEVTDSQRKCSLVTAQMQGLWMGCPCARV